MYIAPEMELYYGLRSYGTDPVIWGGSPDCDHTLADTAPGKVLTGGTGTASAKQVSNAGSQYGNAWVEQGARTNTTQRDHDGSNGWADTRGEEPHRDGSTIRQSLGATCTRCGAWRGELGSESRPDCLAWARGEPPCSQCYVCHLVVVFRAVRRVLHDTGTCWINLGDSMSAGKSGRADQGHSDPTSTLTSASTRVYAAIAPMQRTPPPGLGPKQLLMMPARVALALQSDGWVLRSAITWAKKAPMPECLAPETPVFIRVDGMVQRVTLDDVCDAGEPYPEILTPTGWRPVLNAWETEQEAITFDAAKVMTVTCSPGHQWPVSHDRRRIITHEKTTTELRDDGYRDYLLHHTIDEWLDGNLSHWDGYDLDYDLGWLLGLYAAEGGFGEVRGHRCKLTVHRDEMALIDRATSILVEKFGATVSVRQIKNYISARWSDAEWHRLAPRLVSGKSTTKAINLDVILNAPRDFRQGMWDGYLAGDGSNRSRGVTATSASAALCDGMAVLASSIGLITSKRTAHTYDSRTGRTYVSHQLWTPYVTHRQAKKASTARQLTIRRKALVGTLQRMIDLEVDGGLFLIGDGLVTHNSVRDRPTNATEMVYLLAKNPSYYYDAEAVRQPLTAGSLERGYLGGRATKADGLEAEVRQFSTKEYVPTGANLRNFWLLGPSPYPNAHFATFVPEIPRLAILSGTSARGQCPACGAPWRRVTERSGGPPNNRFRDGLAGDCKTAHAEGTVAGAALSRLYTEYGYPEVRTTGWAPSCTCPPHEPVPQTVLDIFLGSGTTAYVARHHGRRAVGIELNEEYARLAADRLKQGTLGLELW